MITLRGARDLRGGAAMWTGSGGGCGVGLAPQPLADDGDCLHYTNTKTSKEQLRTVSSPVTRIYMTDFFSSSLII